MKTVAIICLTLLAILLCWTIYVPWLCINAIQDIAESYKEEA